ncbi:MAG: hypothetical protein WA992_06415, partial [Desulfobulbales bacterium]
ATSGSQTKHPGILTPPLMERASIAQYGSHLLAVIYNDPVADNKTDPPQTINFYRQHNKYWHNN